MLEKINMKKNVNILSCVQKHDILTTKNMHIVTRQGTKTGPNNPQISKIKNTNGYPDPLKEKKLIKKPHTYFKTLHSKKTLLTVDLAQHSN